MILEITETALMADPARAARTLPRAGARRAAHLDRRLRGRPTSLGYLATLPISELKIDKGFVLSMLTDDRNTAIVRSVIELGHSLGFTVTAEGVETVEMPEQLTALRCDTVQGYLLARPATVRRAVRADGRGAHRPDLEPGAGRRPPSLSRHHPESAPHRADTTTGGRERPR